MREKKKKKGKNTQITAEPSYLCSMIFFVYPSTALIKLCGCHPSCIITAAQKELLWSQTEIRFCA